VIKRTILLILFCCYSQNVYASFWDAVASCFTDICNCGDSDGTRYENWDGKRYNRGKKNRLCPPWNKAGGRDDNICLLKKGYPGTGIGYYENICAEKTTESTYFTPKIKVRGQQCNALACWTTDDTLDWDGECVLLASGYGLPLHRMCARVASPENPKKSLPMDPGYTKGKHLNSEGATKDDEPFYDESGNKLTFDVPKLCLYKDPSFFSFSSGSLSDPMDLNPLKQPYHKTTKVHPIVKAIQFLIKVSSTIAQAPATLLSALFGLMDDDDGETTISSILKDLFSFLAKVISWVGDLFIKFLDEVGQINRTVEEEEYGCVNLPLGPFPPPFCESVSNFFQTAKTQKVCHKINGDLVSSSSDSGCVVSTLENNFVHNSIRVSYDDLVPLCKDKEDPLETDKCVRIKNLGSFSSAKSLHAVTLKRDIIKHCDDAKEDEPCVYSKIKHKCSVSSHGCQDGFRVVYGTQIGKSLMHKPYFYDDMSDCPSYSGSACQNIWGINKGEFIDVNLQFPTAQEPTDIMPLKTNLKLQDKESQSTDFTASIVRKSTPKGNDFIQNSDQICVFESSGFMIGCENRVSNYSLKIYGCDNNKIQGIQCSNSYFEPKFIASYDAGDDSTSASITPQSVYNTDSFDSVINLAGNKFESFVTNDDYIVKPFSGDSSPNPSSLYGVYKDDKSPIKDGKSDPNAVYRYGLEYINGKYHLGGKYACLDPSGNESCPANEKLCVLTKLLNSDIVKCSDFAQKSTKYGGLSKCSEKQLRDCASEDSIDKIHGKDRINIKKCDKAIRCYESNVELCKISTHVNDRVNPKPDLGKFLSDSQYYKVSAKSEYKKAPTGVAQNYDADEYALRNKTPVERGLCYNIPQPSCAEQNDYSEDNGFAYWPSVIVGKISEGRCKEGWEPVAPLKRYCVPNSKDKSFSFERLYEIDEGIVSDSRVYSNVKCKKKPPKKDK